MQHCKSLLPLPHSLSLLSPRALMAEAVTQEELQEVKDPIPPEEPKNHASTSRPKPTITTARPTSVFAFWAYFTLFVSLLTFLLASLPSLRPPDHRSWFLTLPDDLRRHYSDGRLIKVHTGPGRPPAQIFVADHGPRDDAETVLILPGLGCSSFSFRRVLRSLSSAGLRAVALDLPGSGFSDELGSESDRRYGGPLGWIWGVYRDVREKGVFWGFDHLVEHGQIPHEERRRAPVDGSAEMGWVVAQVFDSMSLSPVHLVLHDSALGIGANWVSTHPSAVRSVMLIDSAAEFAAFPSRLLGVPVLREVLLGSQSVFAGLLRLCCSRTVDRSVTEAYRLLLRGNNGRRGLVEAGKRLNYSFDLGEWAGSEAVRDLPVQILWSNTWSDVWIDEGRRAAAAVPRAKFASHSGGRWPQEGSADEIAGMIAQYVLSLPKSIRPISEEPIPEHIQKMFDEAESGQHGHHHHHDHHHGHEHAAGYMNMYGLNQGWGS